MEPSAFLGARGRTARTPHGRRDPTAIFNRVAEKCDKHRHHVLHVARLLALGLAPLLVTLGSPTQVPFLLVRLPLLPVVLGRVPLRWSVEHLPEKHLDTRERRHVLHRVLLLTGPLFLVVPPLTAVVPLPDVLA